MSNAADRSTRERAQFRGGMSRASECMAGSHSDWASPIDVRVQFDDPAKPACRDTTGPAVLVLAGGQGRRCGGRDKGWMRSGGEVLIERQLRLLRTQAWPVAISANRSLPRYRALGVTVFEDDMPDFAGPLAGIAAALRAGFGNPLQILPVDASEVPGPVMRALLATATAHGVPAFAVDAEGMQPLVSAWPRSTLAAIDEALAGSDRSVRGLLTRLDAIAVEFRDASFGNLNTPAQMNDRSATRSDRPC